MHILSVTDFLGNVGGAELSAHTITSGLVDHPDVSNVTVVGVDLPDTNQLDFSGGTVDPVSVPKFVDVLPDYVADQLIERLLARRIRSYLEDVDLIHAHHRRGMLALANVDTKIPTFGTVRDYWPVCPISVYTVDGEQCTGCNDRLDDCISYQGWDGLTSPAVKRYLLIKRSHQRSAFDGIDKIIFISRHLQEQVSGAMETPPNEIIYNPVAVDQPPHLEPPAKPLFVTASSLTKEKGVDIAVAAMERLSQSFPDARLVIFGDGNERTKIEHQADRLPEETIEFKGRVPPDEVYETIRTATATIFPSRWDEPFGRITVESMQLGTPVVGAAVGGIAEVIEEGKTGFLFQRNDPDAVADALRLLLTNEERWLRMARAGIEAGHQFLPEHIIEDYICAFKHL